MICEPFGEVNDKQIMVNLILTIDYEIFGNGTGDVRCCMINPMNRLLDLCDHYDAKLTIFFEVCEYWAFKKARAEGKLSHLNYDPVLEMELQAKDAIKRGHDVQLHLHPQWLNSEIQNEHWSVDFSMWRIANLVPPSNGRTESDYVQILDIIHRGKETLENLIHPLKPDYRCIAFRAGALGIQPEENVLRAMNEVGILIDSSVMPFLKVDDGLQKYDFRTCPCEPVYPISNSVTNVDPQGSIWEVPISVKRFSFFELDFSYKIRRKLKKSKFPTGCSGSYTKVKKLVPPSNGRNDKIQNFNPFRSRTVSLDLSSSCNTIFKFIDFAKKVENKGQIYPLILMGHTKSFGDDKEFEKFLYKSAKKFRNNEFIITLSEFFKLQLQ